MDSVTLTVIYNALVNIAREMGLTMMRTAYSPIFNEALDFSVVIFDDQARMMAQAEFCPSQIGAIRYTVGWTIEELGLEGFRPGDVVIHNDPYRGNGHIPEHMVVKPVYVSGELFGFVANIGHMAEIGGKAPGGFAADATDVYQEGLRLPPVKIVDQGRDVEDIWKVILTNHRTPRNSYGDLKAMIGSLYVAENRLVKLVEQYGVDTMRQASGELMDLAEQRMRAEIARIPDGEYEFDDLMEDDGVTDRPRRIHLAVTIAGDDLIADWTGTEPQALGPTNCTYGSTASAVFNALFQLTDPTIPKNEGCYRPVHIVAPPGTIVNVQHPGPEVAGHTEVNPRLTFMVIGALAQAVPERVVAADGGTSCNFLFGGVHPDTGRFYANYHFEGVGWGGRPNGDGNNAQCAIVGNCRNTPVEVFETRYPWRTLSYRLRPDSGGPGEYRGGLGTDRVMEVIAPEITLSVMMDRMKVQPWGIFGGQGGGNAGVFIQRPGDVGFRTFQEAFGTVSPTKFANIRLQRGDKVLLRSAGGGGYGAPLERRPEHVVADLRRGLVTIEQARDSFGVVVTVTPAGLVLDNRATLELRQARSGSPAEDSTELPEFVERTRRLSTVPDVSRSGSWRTVSPSYLDNRMDHCDFCGKWLPQQAWIDDSIGPDVHFCNVTCTTLYEVYWIPKYSGTGGSTVT
jgi:N-methylhydantoinase B/oxoprolinase/acetone carboxylase alpha subunit